MASSKESNKDSKLNETIDDEIQVVVDQHYGKYKNSITHNNSWTTSMEEQMNSWLYEVNNESDKHDETANYYIFWDDLLSYSGMVITAVGTVLVPFPELTWQIVLVCISVLGVILGFVTRTKNYGNISKVHMDVSKKYQEKANDIREQLVLLPRERINGKQFTRIIKLFLVNTSDLAPTVPDKINKKYNKLTYRAIKKDIVKISIDQGSVRDLTKLRKDVDTKIKEKSPGLSLADLQARVNYEMNRNATI